MAPVPMWLGQWVSCSALPHFPDAVGVLMVLVERTGAAPVIRPPGACRAPAESEQSEQLVASDRDYDPLLCCCFGRPARLARLKARHLRSAASRIAAICHDSRLSCLSASSRDSLGSAPFSTPNRAIRLSSDAPSRSLVTAQSLCRGETKDQCKLCCRQLDHPGAGIALQTRSHRSRKPPLVCCHRSRRGAGVSAETRAPSSLYRARAVIVPRIALDS